MVIEGDHRYEVDEKQDISVRPLDISVRPLDISVRPFFWF